MTIVSGLARGIDAEAHRGALEAGGRTLGVLACGLDRIYPPEHRQLVEEMLENGAILSEMPLGVAPRREFFPLRNRIISGLCLATIVVEARRRSGSLITVRHALNQGREVFVVPGSIDGPFAEGTNQLLRDGARPIRSGSDGPGSLALADAPAGADGDDLEPLPQIVKTKRFHLGPLEAEEAVLKMEQLGHGFFFFINKDTNRSAVVYRRDDGDVGLIDEAD